MRLNGNIHQIIGQLTYYATKTFHKNCLFCKHYTKKIRKIPIETGAGLYKKIRNHIIGGELLNQ